MITPSMGPSIQFTLSSSLQVYTIVLSIPVVSRISRYLSMQQPQPPASLKLTRMWSVRARSEAVHPAALGLLSQVSCYCCNLFFYPILSLICASSLPRLQVWQQRAERVLPPLPSHPQALAAPSLPS